MDPTAVDMVETVRKSVGPFGTGWLIYWANGNKIGSNTMV